MSTSQFGPVARSLHFEPCASAVSPLPARTFGGGPNVIILVEPPFFSQRSFFLSKLRAIVDHVQQSRYNFETASSTSRGVSASLFSQEVQACVHGHA